MDSLLLTDEELFEEVRKWREEHGGILIDFDSHNKLQRQAQLSKIRNSPELRNYIEGQIKIAYGTGLKHEPLKEYTQADQILEEIK